MLLGFFRGLAFAALIKLSPIFVVCAHLRYKYYLLPNYFITLDIALSFSGVQGTIWHL
jgi:hypothetical protein